MNLSAHFTLAELIASDWASRNFVDNTPPPDIIENLKRIAAKLEEVRTILGFPIQINSGYRNSKINKAIGGKPTSSHVQGLAADIKCPQFGTPEQVCRKIADSAIHFDQLIMEYATPDGRGWTHIGIGAKNRQQVLTINQYGVHSGIHI